MKPRLHAIRFEILAVAVFTLVGALVRFWSFGDIGLTHFDEGVYAAAGLWSLTPGGLGALDPGLVPYAPGGFPFLVGLSFATFGASDSSAVFVSFVCGVLTIPAVAWVTRRSFGSAAGIIAASFAALSMVHIAFSRKALTDAPFLLAWTVALGVGARFLEEPRCGRAVALGLAVALAQYFKYSGWLSGAIAFGSALLGVIVEPSERRWERLARTFGWGGVAAVLAVVAYAPWYRFVADHGGYGALLKHQRAYMGGAGAWLPHIGQQLAQAVALSGGLGWRSTALALGLTGASVGGTGVRALVAVRGLGYFQQLAVLLACATLVLIAGPAWWIGLVVAPWFLLDADPRLRTPAVWWALLTAITPFYHPYARLWLPLEAASWVLNAALLGGLVARLADANPPDAIRFLKTVVSDKRNAGRIVCSLLLAVLAVWQAAASPSRPLPLRSFFEPTTAFRIEAARLASPHGGPEVLRIHVFARRPLLFYFFMFGGRVPIVIAPDIDELLQPAERTVLAVVDEAMLRQANGTQAFLDRVGATGAPPADRRPGTSSENLEHKRARWRIESESDHRLDPVTLLDVDPSAASKIDPHRRVTVWHLTPRTD